MDLVMTKDSTISLDILVVWTNEFLFPCSHLRWDFCHL